LRSALHQYQKTGQRGKLLPDWNLLLLPMVQEALMLGADCEIVFGEPTLIRDVLPST
jgi:hypothetical protein